MRPRDHGASLYKPAYLISSSFTYSGAAAALCEAIEKTHALASIWFSVTQPSPDPRYHRLHQDLVDELLTGDPQRAATAIRGHIRWGMREALGQLEPYFEMRNARGRTFFRSDKRRLRHAAIRPRKVVT